MAPTRLPLPRRFVQSLSAFPEGFGLRPPERIVQNQIAGGASLGRLGHLEVRLASTPAEIRRAQELRYRVFYEEMEAVADADMRRAMRDADRFDDICDHLIVVDRSRRSRLPLNLRPEIVGTYRLLRQDRARRHFGFYSESEYDLQPLLRRKPHLQFLELGRSCVLKPYRNSRTIELLWHGAWRYVLHHGADVMIGCASLPGTDADCLALPLSFLHHHMRASDEWLVGAHGHLRVDMNRMPADAIDRKSALRALPPLLKGYLRLGAKVGDGAVVDRQFGTVDVCIVLPVAAISQRYISYYGPDAQRRAA